MISMNGAAYLKKPLKVSESNAKDFRGQWLAIVNEEIVAHSRDIGKLIDLTRKNLKDKKPEFTRVSGGNIAMY